MQQLIKELGQKKATTYSLALNGEAAEKFKVKSASATTGVFTIYNSEGVTLGTLTATGYNKQATANTDYTDTIVMNATSIKAAAATTAKAAYYDKDGNKISTNRFGSVLLYHLCR